MGTDCCKQNYQLFYAETISIRMFWLERQDEGERIEIKEFFMITEKCCQIAEFKRKNRENHKQKQKIKTKRKIWIERSFGSGFPPATGK